MDRKGQDQSGDDAAKTIKATRERESGSAEPLANADEGADPQKDIDQRAGENGTPDMHMTPHPWNNGSDEDDREEDREAAFHDGADRKADDVEHRDASGHDHQRR